MDRLVGAWFWIGAGLLVSLVLFLGAWAFTRWMRRRLEQPETRVPFTLSDLRDMRAAGTITEAEFQSMKAAMIAELGGTPRPKE